MNRISVLGYLAKEPRLEPLPDGRGAVWFTLCQPHPTNDDIKPRWWQGYFIVQPTNTDAWLHQLRTGGGLILVEGSIELYPQPHAQGKPTNTGIRIRATSIIPVESWRNRCNHP